MAKKFPPNPPHPERNCWGCDRYCAADAMLCGNGSERTQHPVELFGPGWPDWQPPTAAAPGAGPAHAAGHQAA
ncbi:MAG: DUF3079 domain-containing protein [Acidovorax sp.]|nr:DUF3079 domain-containing protein [Acidovorax sp.]